jgi:hypothetical protein
MARCLGGPDGAALPLAVPRKSFSKGQDLSALFALTRRWQAFTSRHNQRICYLLSAICDRTVGACRVSRSQPAFGGDECFAKRVNLVVYGLRIDHGPGDFLSQNFAVPLAQTMNERLYPAQTNL